MGPRLRELTLVSKGSNDTGSRNLGTTFLTITVHAPKMINCKGHSIHNAICGVYYNSENLKLSLVTSKHLSWSIAKLNLTTPLKNCEQKLLFALVTNRKAHTLCFVHWLAIFCFVFFLKFCYQLGCKVVVLLAQRLVEHVKNAFQNIMTEVMKHSVFLLDMIDKYWDISTKGDLHHCNCVPCTNVSSLAARPNFIATLCCHCAALFELFNCSHPHVQTWACFCRHNYHFVVITKPPTRMTKGVQYTLLNMLGYK